MAFFVLRRDIKSYEGGYDERYFYGIIQGMRPVIGYNYGAGEKERVKKIYRLTLYMTGSIMILGTILCLLASGQLIGFFTGYGMHSGFQRRSRH